MPKPGASGADIAQAMQEAAAHFRAGRLAEADKICTRVLKVLPHHFDALHLAGLIKLQSGKAGAACTLIEAALKLNPGVPEVLTNLGIALATGLIATPKRWPPSTRHWRRRRKISDALGHRGKFAVEAARPAEALAAFEQAWRWRRAILACASIAATRWPRSDATRRRSHNTTSCWRSMAAVPKRTSTAATR